MRAKLVCLFSVVLWILPCVGQSTLNYTQIPDVPGGTSGNRANGINARGDIVGHYNDSSGGRHGYLFAKGSAGPTPIDFSTAPFNSSGGTSARGINARGDIVGDYIDNLGADHGYLLSNGVFTSIDATSLGATNTVARGINNIGEIVGEYQDSGGNRHGFFLSKGAFQTIAFPLSSASFARVGGIADDDTMVGAYADASGFIHGFERSSAGVFTSITNSSASNTVARGINAEGDIVGSYTNVFDLNGEKVVGSTGFLLSAGDLIDFLTIAYPAAGVQGTQARGINPRGDIVGAYVDASGADHGFIASR
jgi:uncharacterized membrane protein